MFSVLIHPDVAKFLDKLSEDDRKRCVEALRRLKDDPFTPRPGADIKKLKGRDKTMYRLRVRDFFDLNTSSKEIKSIIIYCRSIQEK
jgi:mRNA interferase RelE/StbE